MAITIHSIQRRNPSSLVFSTTANFLASSYMDYCHSIADNWSKLVGVLNEIMTMDVGENVYDEQGNYLQSTQNPYVQEAIANVLVTSGYLFETDQQHSNWNYVSPLGQTKWYWSSMINFGAGWISIVRLAISLRVAVCDKYCNEGDANWLEGEISLNSADNSTPIATITVSETLDKIQSVMSQSVALYAAFKSASFDDVVERINIFNDTLKNTFSNIYDAGDSAISYFRGIISSVGVKSAEITQSIISALGVENRTEETDPFSATAVGQYTGCSPMPAIDLTTAKGVISATGHVIVSGVKQVFNLLKKGASWLWSKTKQYVINPVVNPYDLKKISDSEYYSVDKYFIPTKVPNIDIHKIGDDAIPDAIWTTLKEKLVNHCFKWHTIFGEVLVKFSDSLEAPGTYYVDAEYNLKPYAVNLDAIKRGFSGLTDPDGRQILQWNDTFCQLGFGNNSNPVWAVPDKFSAISSSISIDNLQTFYSRLKNSSDLYVDIKADNEKDMYTAFTVGITLLKWAITLTGTTDATVLSTEGAVFYINHANNITNKDFLILLSGWDGNNSNPKFSLNKLEDITTNMFDSFSMTLGGGTSWINFGRQMCDLLVVNQYDKINTPLNYQFIPYRKDVSSFEESRYSISTDAENIAAANVVANVIAIITVTAVVILTGVAISAKVSRLLARKRLAKKIAIENTLRQGGKVSTWDMWLYKRANRKLNAQGYLGGNLQSMNSNTSLSGSVFDSNDNDQAIENVRNLITSD